VGITAEESFTYNDFSKLNLGGLKKDGSEGVNELSYLILEVLSEMRTLQPNTAVLISNKNPDRFLIGALKVVGPGFGEPPFFNFNGVISGIKGINEIDLLPFHDVSEKFRRVGREYKMAIHHRPQIKY